MVWGRAGDISKKGVHMNQSKNAVVQAETAAPAVVTDDLPVLAYINPFRSGKGYNLVAQSDLVIKAGTSLAVFQIRNGSYVVKAHKPRAAATRG